MTRSPRFDGPFATLVRTFLGRFFENDLTSNAGDVKTMFFAFLAVMAIPGAVVPLFLAHPTPGLPGWDRIALDQGVEVLRAISRADTVFYLGFAMIAAGGVSAMTWNTLIVDRRDGLILGALPLRAAAIVGAKLIALAAFVAAVAVAMHVLASFSFGVFLASRNTFEFAMRGIAGHFVASSAASMFVLCSAAAAQGLALALLGPRRFARVSPILQAALVVAILGTAVALPAISGAVVVTLGGVSGVTGEARPWIFSTPPLWFLGLYESVIGTTDPTLLRLARTAVVAAVASALTVLVTYPLAYRRLMRIVIEQSDSPRRLRPSAVFIEAITRVVGREPEIRAVAQFFLATLARHQRQRLVVATAFGLAAVWGLPAWMALASRPPEPEIGLLQWAMTAPLFLVAGLRIAAAFPADTASSWIFSVLPPSTRNLRAAVERLILLVGVVPVVTLFSVAIWRLWGPEVAVIHALFSLAVTLLFLQCLLWRFDSVPCTRPWNPSAINLRFWWPAYLAVFLILTRGLPVLDWALVSSPVVAACVIAFFMFITYHLRAIAMVRPTVPADEAAGVLTSALKARWLSRRFPADDVAGSWTGTVPHGDAQAHALLHGSRRRNRWLAVRDFWRDVRAAATPSPGVLRRDIALAIRRLRKAPVFTTFSVLTLGGGVAATTLAFAVIHALLWTRPPISDFDRLVDVSGERFAGGRSRDRGAFSWPDFLNLKAQQTTFASLAASTWHEVPFVGGQASAVVNAGAVNGEFFQTLGIGAALGRLLEPADDRPDAAPVVVLSYNLWRLRFSADPGAIGTAVRVNGDLYRIVGVAPRGFNGADLSNVGRAGAIWVPLQTASGEVPLFRNGQPQTVRQLLGAGGRDARWLGVRGRARARAHD